MTNEVQASAAAQGSARMTLMRGSPDEIERDLAAIDMELSLLREENEHLRLLCADYDYQRETARRIKHLLAEVVRCVPIVAPAWRKTYLYDQCVEATLPNSK